MCVICVSVCTMCPPVLRLTTWSRRRLFVITRRHMSSSILLHNSTSFPLVSGPLGMSFSFENPHEKAQGFRSGMRAGQKMPYLWRSGKRLDMTRGPKTVFQKSSTASVCSVAPSCINCCVIRGKPFAVSCGKKSFWSTCKYRSEFAVSLKKIGQIKTWLDIAAETATFLLWLLSSWAFSGGSVLHNGMFCLFAFPSKMSLAENHVLNEFNLFLLPRLRTEVSFLSHHKVYTPKDFVWEHFRIHSKYSLHWASRRSVHTSCLPCLHVRSGQTLLILHTPLLFKPFELRSIVFLAGAQWVRKMVRNHLCVPLTLFVTANTKTTLDFCSTVNRHFNELPPSR